ncbi:MAG: DUF4115 domain-containing protein, partial [Gallionella sp.]
EQDNGPAADTVASPGKMLREARERLGLSVADVAGQIKFAPRQIEALEADDFRNLPEMAFVRGFVRSYARILHLDAQALLAALPQTDAVPAQPIPASVEVPFPDAHSSQRQNRVWLGAALLLAVLVVAFAAWHFTAPPAQPETAQVETPVSLPAEIQIIPASRVPEAVVAASSAPQTQPAKPAAQPGTAPQLAALHLVFDEASWVEIKDKNGKLLPSQINPRGSELRLNGQAPFSLVIGHAAGVRLYYREKQVDLKPYTGVDVARLTLE